MSASNPEAIARLWAPEPLYDSSNRTVRPVCRLPLGRERGQDAVVERLADDRVGPDRQRVGPPPARREPGARRADAGRQQASQGQDRRRRSRSPVRIVASSRVDPPVDSAQIIQSPT